ncbi:Endonuclease III [Methanocaldococcus lauensis]|nr:Endonuclease III [Methanocaldococcus lauensis]
MSNSYIKTNLNFFVITMNSVELIEILSKKINKNAVVTEISKDRDPFKVLISTIISARTKDEVTEEVSKRLFNVVKDVDDLLKIDEEELAKLIYPAGFYKNKAKNLKKLAIILKENYNGKVPDSLEDLLKLPGVGRKTANLVITLAFDKDGICVDTHVHRICNRWEIVDTETPEETEFELRKKLPKKYWKIINNLLVVFGREICSPKPKCDKCFEEIRLKCPYYKKIKVFENILKKFDFKKVSKNKIPNEKGTYILKIKLKEGKKIKFGKKEEFFKKGIYFYVGSAYGNSINLKNRIERHLKDDKKMHWHIDYLLKYGKVEEIFITNKRVECEVANEFIKEFDYIERFGCSDCNCKSHLFYMKP